MSAAIDGFEFDCFNLRESMIELVKSDFSPEVRNIKFKDIIHLNGKEIDVNNGKCIFVINSNTKSFLKLTLNEVLKFPEVSFDRDLKKTVIDLKTADGTFKITYKKDKKTDSISTKTF